MTDDQSPMKMTNGTRPLTNASEHSRMNVHQHRKGLARTRAQIQKGELSIGYIGGSITDGRTGYNWPDPVTRWVIDRFPNVRIREDNAAIGATGSELAVFRAQADLIDAGCDL